MTREQMRLRKEYEALINKQLFKPTAKQFGFKIISGSAYRKEGDWLYIVDMFVRYDSLLVKIGVKSLLLDELFWEIFEMKAEVAKKPLSFHINAAFVPYSLTFREWITPFTGIEHTAEVLEQAFTECRSVIAQGLESIQSISDYRELLMQKNHVNMLNVMLCDIAEERYTQALAKAEQELASGQSGGFVTMEKGDIYNYIVRYCQERLKR